MGKSDWYKLEANEVLSRLESTESGLGMQLAAQRLAEHGPNSIPERKKRSVWSILSKQFHDFLVIVLLAAALISGFVGELQDSIAILVIVFLNAIIGAIQEYRAERAVAVLKALSAPEANVLREGQIITLPASDLVPGDVVLLEAGNVVPADLRLVETEDLQADESALTGESHPVAKVIEVLDGEELPVGDRKNQVFKSCLITRGRGTGVVVATGLDTEIGRIAELLHEAGGAKSPLQVRLARFGRNLALAVLGICMVVFVAGLLQGQSPMLMLLTAVSLAVAAIPEALPAVVTISLALGAHKLIRYQALMRNLPAVETLGSVTYICADKTGTLTQNCMTADLYYTNGNRYDTLLPDHPVLSELGTAMALNNDVVEKDHDIAGEPTELALFQAALEAGFEKRTLEEKYPRLDAIPFDSERKQMTTVHSVTNGAIAYVKGAPERVLTQCVLAAEEQEVGKYDRDTIAAEAEQLASEGYRVLALAKRDLSGLPDVLEAESLERELVFLGLVALIDPPREEAEQAVVDCLTAGITPVMITGDHPGTALAIAKRLGITESEQRMLSGSELAELSDERLSHEVENIQVYARVTPDQKLRIVKALQDNNEFVAMTGDGVNDAPALKKANIGISMGQKGTDVAREASDMVLLDDNYATIVRAIRFGRHIFDNIRKFIKDTMSSNSGEIWTLFLAPFMGLPIPLLPIHILWINLVTDGLPGLAFTAEPAEKRIMERPPRPPKENIFAHGMWQHIVWVGLFVAGVSISAMAWAISRGVPYWQTIVFTVLTVSQLFHSLAVRSETESLFSIGLFSNLPMLGAVLLTLLFQFGVIYIPALNGIFHTQPLPLYDLVVCLLLSSLVLVAVEFEKWLVRNGVLYNNEKR